MSSEEKSCTCLGKKNVKVLFPCSGAADVGEISDRAARKLSRDGQGKMLCLAGIGGNVKGMIASAEAADVVLAIDGCGLDCAAKTLKEKGIPGFRHLRITDLGMEKSKSPATDAAVNRVALKANELLA